MKSGEKKFDMATAENEIFLAENFTFYTEKNYL